MANRLNCSKLEQEVSKHKLTKLQMAEKCGISRVTLDKVLAGKEIGLHKFLNIIDILGKPVGYFFDECEEPTTGRATALDHSAASINGNATVHVNTAPSTSTPADAEKIAHLEALLAEKERAIQDKERTIQILLNK